MKKSTIWLLVLIMAAAFVSLLYLQIEYMESMIQMRSQQFSEAVKRSLYGVSKSLEQDETMRYLMEDVSNSEIHRLAYDAQHSANKKLFSIEEHISITSKNGSIPDFSFNSQHRRITINDPSAIVPKQNSGSSISNKYRNLQEALKGRYIYQKGLLDEVVLNILGEASLRPIMERVDVDKIDNYLQSELQNNGLNVPFQFAVVNNCGEKLYATKDYWVDNNSALFTQVLFPNDPPNNLNYLKVYFPTKRNYVYNSINFMLPSLGFTFILLITFLFTIVIAFRQKKLSEMKNDFINNMTHEFKTPISTISLAAQMLNDEAVVKNTATFKHISGVINDETKRLRFQVEKVLQMSMFDRQKTLLKLVEVEANVLVANVTSTFKLKVEKYGGAIEADLMADNDLVEVDEMHFTNVVFNLLDNAVKYSKPEVPLHLKVDTTTVGDKWQLTIQDNGIGIKKDDLKKIFEKFYRVSTGNVHNVKGFGLGLAYVNKIVKDHHGTIHVESEFNIGTKFIIQLPLIKN